MCICCTLRMSTTLLNEYGMVWYGTVEVFIDGTRLPFVASCRDLGVTISADLTPSIHVNNIVIKGHQRANAIHRCFVSRDFLFTCVPY